VTFRREQHETGLGAGDRQLDPALPPIGWSVATRRPTFSVQKARARSWSLTGMLTNFTCLITLMSLPSVPHEIEDLDSRPALRR
jgi:hypothetical protein